MICICICVWCVIGNYLVTLWALPFGLQWTRHPGSVYGHCALSIQSVPSSYVALFANSIYIHEPIRRQHRRCVCARRACIFVMGDECQLVWYGKGNGNSADFGNRVVAVAANQNNAWIDAYLSCWSSQITRLRRTIMAELIFRVSLCCIFFLNFLARKLNEMRWQTDSYEKQNWVINEN